MLLRAIALLAAVAVQLLLTGGRATTAPAAEE